MALFQSPLCSSLGTTEDDPLSQLNRSLRMQEIMSQHRHQMADQSASGRRSSTCTQVVWIFFWLIVLLLIAYPVALVAALLYALLNPFALLDCCRPATSLLLDTVNLPRTCVKNIAEAKQLIIM